MIEIIPAIDLIDGCCVRLQQGDYNEKKVYSDSPVEVALRFAEAGARWLHLVDLDGAKASRPCNLPVWYAAVLPLITLRSLRIGCSVMAATASYWGPMCVTAGWPPTVGATPLLLPSTVSSIVSSPAVSLKWCVPIFLKMACCRDPLGSSTPVCKANTTP